VSVKNLIVKHRGYAETRVFNEPFLNGVGEGGSFSGSFALALASNLPDTVFHHLLCLFY
jgi:hypothetical protein